MESPLISSWSCLSSTSSDTDIDEASKSSSPIVYTPHCIDARWRSGRYMVSERFFRAEQLAEDVNFLTACFLCKKALSRKNEIFMYRGNVPFCSEECREEQIDMDESLENCRMFSGSAGGAGRSASTAMKRKPSIIIRTKDCMRTDTAIVAG